MLIRFVGPPNQWIEMQMLNDNFQTPIPSIYTQKQERIITNGQHPRHALKRVEFFFRKDEKRKKLETGANPTKLYIFENAYFFLFSLLSLAIS